jgi:hypothetical protein
MLGDLAPLIWLFKKFEKTDPITRRRFQTNYDFTETEMNKLYQLRNNIKQYSFVIQTCRKIQGIDA